MEQHPRATDQENVANNIRSFSVPIGQLPHHETTTTTTTTTDDRRNTSFSSVDSFDLQLFTKRQQTASFSSPDIPRITRKKFHSYGSLATPFADLNDCSDDTASFDSRPRGRSEHAEEEENDNDDEEEQRIAIGGGRSTLSPIDTFTGRSVRHGVSQYDDSSSQLLRGHYQLRSSGGHPLWAEKGTPGTNQARKLRELSTAFDQYLRSRRKVCLITCGMAASFTFLCAMTSRMAAGGSGHASGKLPVAPPQLVVTTTDDEALDALSPSSTWVASSDVAAQYLTLGTLAAVISCFSSFLFFWWISVRKRVTISMFVMLVPLITLIIVETSKELNWNDKNGYPEIIMITSGASFGMFLPSIMSVVSPHGPNTKLWLTLGLPLGKLVVEMLFVVADGTTSNYGILPVTITAGVVILLIVFGMCIHLFGIPHVHVDHNGDSARAVCAVLWDWKMWVRFHLVMGCFASFVSTACISMFSVGAVSMALEKHTTVSLFGGGMDSEWIVPQGLVMGVYAVFGLIGGVMGRKMAYMVEDRGDGSNRASTHSTCADCFARTPITFVAVTLVGGGVIASAFKIQWGVLLPVGVFLLGYGYGFVLNMMVRYIDCSVPREANLSAYVLLLGSSFGGSCLVWAMPVWMHVATWMGGD